MVETIEIASIHRLYRSPELQSLPSIGYVWLPQGTSIRQLDWFLSDGFTERQPEMAEDPGFQCRIRLESIWTFNGFL